MHTKCSNISYNWNMLYYFILLINVKSGCGVVNNAFDNWDRISFSCNDKWNIIQRCLSMNDFASVLLNGLKQWCALLNDYNHENWSETSMVSGCGNNKYYLTVSYHSDDLCISYFFKFVLQPKWLITVLWSCKNLSGSLLNRKTVLFPTKFVKPIFLIIKHNITHTSLMTLQ